MISLHSPSIHEDNINTIVGWLNDKELMRYSENRHKQHTAATQIEYIMSFLYNPGDILREIHLDDVLIGTITAIVDRNNRVANVGILIGKGFGGNEHGYEAWAMLCNSLFEHQGMRRIEAGCMALNMPMIKIMRRYGMKEEGRRMSHFMVDGAYSDLVLYGRFR
jgi:RimJ/RimL family protein N-acetyltransferase